MSTQRTSASEYAADAHTHPNMAVPKRIPMCQPLPPLHPCMCAHFTCSYDPVYELAATIRVHNSKQPRTAELLTKMNGASLCSTVKQTGTAQILTWPRMRLPLTGKSSFTSQNCYLTKRRSLEKSSLLRLFTRLQVRVCNALRLRSAGMLVKRG